MSQSEATVNDSYRESSEAYTEQSTEQSATNEGAADSESPDGPRRLRLSSESKLAVLSLEHAFRKRFSVKIRPFTTSIHASVLWSSQPTSTDMDDLYLSVGYQFNIDLTRPNGRYSDTEMQTIKRVADILFILRRVRLSFPLYVFLIKQYMHRSAPGAQVQLVLLTCMRSVSTLEHCLIFQALVKSILANANFPTIPQFFMHILLAANCLRVDAKEDARLFLDIAHELAPHRRIELKDSEICFEDPSGVGEPSPYPCSRLWQNEETRSPSGTSISSPQCFCTGCMLRKFFEKWFFLLNQSLTTGQVTEWQFFSATFYDLMEKWDIPESYSFTKKQSSWEDRLGISIPELAAIFTFRILEDASVVEYSNFDPLRHIQLERVTAASLSLLQLSNGQIIDRIFSTVSRKAHTRFFLSRKKQSDHLSHFLIDNIILASTLDLSHQKRMKLGRLLIKRDAALQARGINAKVDSDKKSICSSNASSETRSFFNLACNINRNEAIKRSVSSLGMISVGKSSISQSDWVGRAFIRDDLSDRMSCLSFAGSQKASSTLSMSIDPRDV